MILTCPACSTRYLVNPTSIGSDGRMVRCAKCGHTWMQSPPQDMPKTVEPPEAAEARPIPPGSNLPAFPRRHRRRARAALGWVALVAVVAGAVAAAGLYRERIVALWPPAARLYAQLDLAPAAAPGAGLELRNISLSHDRESDTDVLVVEGQVANPTDEVLDVPALRGALVAADRRELRHWTFTTDRRRLLPGEIAAFRTELRDPESGATDISITFTAPAPAAGDRIEGEETGPAPAAPDSEMGAAPAGEG